MGGPLGPPVSFFWPRAPVGSPRYADAGAGKGSVMGTLRSSTIAACLSGLILGGCGGGKRIGALSDLDPPKRECDTPTTTAASQYHRPKTGTKELEDIRPQLRTLQRAVDKAALQASPLVKGDRVPSGTPLTRPIEVLCLSGGGQYGAL